MSNKLHVLTGLLLSTSPCRMAVHMDCLHWVNRDSYLPQGSRGLKVRCLRCCEARCGAAAGRMLPCTCLSPLRCCPVARWWGHLPLLHPPRLCMALPRPCHVLLTVSLLCLIPPNPAPDGDQVQAGLRPGGS